MSPEPSSDAPQDPTERTEPQVFDAGEQPGAEQVETEDPGPKVWVQKGGGGESVGGTIGDDDSSPKTDAELFSDPPSS